MIAKLIKAVWVLEIIAFILCGCSNSIPTPNSTTDKTKTPANFEADIPIAIVSLENQTVMFECVDGHDNCIPDIDIKDYALLERPYHLGSIYYCNPSSIYLLIYSSHTVPWERSVIHYNPKTKEVKSARLPKELEFLNSLTVGGSLILVGDSGSNIYIINNNLSIKRIDVESPINKLLGANDHEVIALNEQPVERDGDYSIEVYIINIESGQFSKVYLKLPGLELRDPQLPPQAEKKYLVNVEGISRDLKYLYCLYFLGDLPKNMRLGIFDIRNSKEIASTQDPSLIPLTTGYTQYREFLFANSTLIDMLTISSLLDFDNNPELKRGKRLVPIPFGEFFLLNLIGYAVFRISQRGEILDKYTIPEEWLDKDYRVMYYLE